MKTSKVYVNGQFYESDKACISVFDRGFLFADSLYEVVPIFDGKFFLFDEHLVRMRRGLKEVFVDLPDVDFIGVARELIGSAQLEHGILYIQISRGAGAFRNHMWKPNELKPTVVLFLQDSLAAGSSSDKGLRVITIPDLRWSRCDIKSVGLLPNILARYQAEQSECDEAIFCRGQNITEGTSTNVFAVFNGKIKTPKLASNILPGVTRQFCLDRLKEFHFDFSEDDISCDELCSADEIWLTSSTKDVLPVVEINGSPVGQGKPGPVWEQFSELYQQSKVQYLKE